MIAVMYAIMGGGLLKALVDPATSGIVSAILGLLPSSWGAEIFVSFASNPSNIAAVGLEIFARVGGLILFFLAALWLGAKAANRAYSLESITFISPKVRPDGVFYKTIKYLGGAGPFGTLLASIFKDYGRRLENLSYLVYAVGLIVMLRIFLSDPYLEPTDPLFNLSEFAIPMLAAFAVGTVSRGKENLFLYKKSPSGIGKFVKARLLQAWFVTVPIAVVLMSVSTILVPQFALTSLIINVIMGSLRTVAAAALVLGLALVTPVFAEESRERAIGMIVNLMVVLFVTIGMEIGLPRLGLSFAKILPNSDRVTGLLYDNLLQTAIFSIMGIALLYTGTKKLSAIE
jgi:hypothetical protein